MHDSDSASSVRTGRMRVAGKIANRNVCNEARRLVRVYGFTRRDTFNCFVLSAFQSSLGKECYDCRCVERRAYKTCKTVTLVVA